MDIDSNDQDSDEETTANFDFGRYLEALRKYVWAVLAIMALMITAAVIYTRRQPNVFQAEASVQIEPRLPDLLGQKEDVLSRAVIGGIDYYAQQQHVLGSYRLIRQTVEHNKLYTRLLSEDDRKDRKPEEVIELATKRLKDSLSIKYPTENRIMYVVVKSKDPQLAADIANLHVSTYVDYSKGLLTTEDKQASGALSTEFDDAETKLRDAESALFMFQKDNDLLAVSIEERQSLASSEITSYSVKLHEAHAHRLELFARLERMRKASEQDVLSSPILLLGDSVAFEHLRTEYYEQRNKFIELEKEIGPKNTQYQMQKAKIDDLYNALASEAKRMLNGLEEQVKASIATEAALKAEVDRATKEALELGPKLVSYNELKRRKMSLEDRYNILRTRLSTSELSDRMNRNFDSSNVRPLDPALVPKKPVSPVMQVNIAIATVLSLMIGLGLVFLIVFLDRTIKSTSDAQQATGSPVLGIIPMLEELTTANESTRDLYVHQQPTSRVAECCRSLRTNIMFSAADRQIKTIVVSSANPREGKTTSVIYLGTTMAQSGQRVLLIDTDMRRPRLHVSMGIPRSSGLSNLILGDQNYDDVIKTTEIPGLFVLPCGPLPPNPAELLMTHRFEVVLEELGKRFDRIILDSPPLQVVTDAVVLSKSKYVDGVILVAQAGKTPREEIRRAARQIKDVGGTIFGVIVNALELDQRSGYYYSYYGYTEKSPEPQA